MIRKIFSWALLFIVILTLLAVQSIPRNAGKVLFANQNAYAGELQSHIINLPLILKYFPPPLPAFGVELGPITTNYGLDQMVQAGASWVRRNGINWSEIEPIKGTKNWETLSGLETELITAQQNGLQVILIVRGTPAWAQRYQGYECGPIKAEELDAFAGFMKEVVARYSVEPYNVKYWEIWNEPDAPAQNGIDPDGPFGCWGDPNDYYYGGGYYGEMLAKVTPQIRAADPSAQILVGGLLLDCDPLNPPVAASGFAKDCSSSRFLEGILRAGGADYFDGVSFHAYDYYAGELGKFSNTNWHTSWDTTGPGTIAKVNYIKSLLGNPEFGAQGKFLMNTETALICGEFNEPPGIPPCSSDANSAFEFTKAYYLTKAYTLGQFLGLRASLWFNIFGWRNSGILYEDLSPRPAHIAYSVAQNALDQLYFKRQISDNEGVEGYEFGRDGERIWVLWSKDGVNHAINLGAVPSSVYDVFGTPITPSGTLQIGHKPIYIEWLN